MNKSPCRCATCLSILVLALAAWSACSSSTPLKKTADAAIATDLGSGDLASRDATDDAPSADTRAADDLASTGDVALDLVTNETFAPDAWPRDLSVPDLFADGSVDHPLPCTAGMNQTCNDSLLVSSIWGTCQPDGTCLCTAGHVVNPNTGRCRMAPAKDASASSDTDPGTCTGDYTACGCGCCGGVQSRTSCYYPSLGETIAAITAQDLATKSATDCAHAGCSLGIHYVCCARAAPEPSSSAAYTATGYTGGLDHVAISKSGSDCATLSFARPLTDSNSALRISMPPSWGISNATFGACGDAGVLAQADGAVGTLALRSNGDQCLADLHATLFAFTADGNVKTSRLDVDGVAVTVLPAGLCH
jgi:hypothetical protein